MFKRSIIVVVSILGVLVLLGGLVWYLAFWAGPSPPPSVNVSTLAQSVSVSWTENGLVQVDAASLDDGIIGLGYGMGRTRAWQLVLWRQAALGQLSSWFGDDIVPADYLTIQLEIAEQAKQDYAALSEEQREPLDRLTDGLNSALTANDLARGAPFLLLEIEPERWESWHSIAVERLFSWIAGNPFPTSDTTFTAQANRSLREVLQVDGFEYNWIASSFNDSTSFVSARFVTGRTASPFFVEAQINTPGRNFIGLMVPGTLVTPLGLSSATASQMSSEINYQTLSWGFLLNGNARITNERLRSDELEVIYRRIATEKQENLVTVFRSNSRMPLISTSRDVESRSVPVLNWPAFSHATDSPVWMNLIGGERAEPSLIHSDGLMRVNNESVVVGSPTVQLRDAVGRLFVADAPASSTPSDRFSALPDVYSLSDLLTDSFNQTAVSENRQYLSYLPDSVRMADRLQEGKLYLANWNFEYNASEIGASIFELMRRKKIQPNSNMAINLTRVLDEMAISFGTDMSGWRWENVQERLLRFPGTTTGNPDGGRPEASFNAKFNPIDVGGPGHPQTFVWGTAHQKVGLSYSSAWEGGLELGSQDIFFRRPFIDYSAFLGSFLSSKRPIELERFSSGSFKFTTSLFPVQ